MLGFLILLVVSGVQSQELTIHKPGVNDQCAKFCDTKFDGKENSTQACKEGCRFFTLLQLTNSPPIDESAQKFHDECSKSCRESYTNDKDLKLACELGCQNQTLQSGSIQVEMDSRSPLFNKVAEFSNKMFQPMMNMFNDFDGGMRRMMNRGRGLLGRPSERDDDLSLDFSRDPIISKMLDQMHSMMNFDDFFSKPTPLDSGRQKTLAPEMPQPQNQIDNKDDSGEPILTIHMIPLTKIDQPIVEDVDDSATLDAIKNLAVAREPSPPILEMTDDDWMSCVGRRIRHLSILTKWTLCLAMMLSLVGMMWLCLAILYKPKKQRHLHYIMPSAKGGVDNVYYTTPPFNAGDKAPMIVKSGGGEYVENKKALDEAALAPPPAYEAAVKEEKN